MVVPVALRAYYAELVTGRAGSMDHRLVEAFTVVERERFVGPGPWKVSTLANRYVDTPSDDPVYLYHNVVVALVPERGLNNGEPQLHARCLAALWIKGGETAVHIGSGTGYYTAILAELVGPTGTVHAYEIDQDIASKAAANLAPWPNVSVKAQSATAGKLPACDIVYVSAGATRPPDAWLDALASGGRLLFPLTPNVGLGGMLLVTRAAASSFDARFVQPATFIFCEGARDGREGDKLAETFAEGRWAQVKSLRRGVPPDDSSWYAGDGWWLSTSSDPPQT
jgi:protein-L-isoaspartate(D-aspartate) O-methyltransferase